jgi:hypothetical protein
VPIKVISTTDLTPLTSEARVALATKEAALHLSLSPQTLRLWAQTDSGPITPTRVNGRFYWRVIDLARLLEGNSVSRSATNDQ